MRVLMLGWEFPPFMSGGLGTACHALSKGLAAQGVGVTFVMPHIPDGAKSDFVRLRGTNECDVKIRAVKTILTPYMNESTYHETYKKKSIGSPSAVYGKDLFAEIERYTLAAQQIAKEEPHDVVHAHDWMTFKAALAIKKRSSKKVVVHIHATEYDRTGGKPNEYIRKVEEEGLKGADHVVTISEYMKRQIIKNYSIDHSKISVAHWGLDQEALPAQAHFDSPLKRKDKIVLMLGRITIQKGPDYFVEAAKKVLCFEPNARFVMAGDGDMLPRMMNRVLELGIASRFTFTGFLKGADVSRAYKMADVFVMPSVSEPFGLVALEAMQHDVPVIVSKTSGVAEVASHTLKVDFWDVNGLAEKIVSVLRHKALSHELKINGRAQVDRLTINEPARKVIDVYKTLGVAG